MLEEAQELGGGEGLVSVTGFSAFGGGEGEDQGGQCMAGKRDAGVGRVGGGDAGSALGERREHETQ